MVNFRRTLSLLVVGGLIFGVALIIILFARGYRINIAARKLNTQGILITQSSPRNAQIYINNEFYGFTPNNIYLNPGEYKVTIKKEGYSEWQKTYNIKGEIVSRADVLLFSSNPSLSPLTNRGIINPTLSPSKEQVAYFVLPEEGNFATEETGGIFIAKTSSQTLAIFRQRTLLISYTRLPVNFIPEKIKFIFSPDEKNILGFFYNEYDVLLSAILISSNETDGQFFDVTFSYQTLLEKWQSQQDQIKEKILDTFKTKIKKALEQSAYLIDLSPDKSKSLYFTLQEATIPLIITPSLIGSIPTREVRTTTPGEFYIYDAKEDKNFHLELFSQKERQELLKEIRSLQSQDEITIETYSKINTLFNKVLWYSNSKHLIYIDEDTISTIEYDGKNKTLVYSGPSEESFIAVREGKLIILTNINPKKNKFSDLYTVSIK